MDTLPICPICQAELSPDEVICPVCGSAVTVSRTTISSPLPETSNPEKLRPSARTQTDALALYIMGREKPVVFEENGEILLGRAFTEGQSPHVDLDAYHGYKLGVSRMHARILFSGNRCSVSDLNSTNGTFVNETRIPAHEPHPVRNGDFIRLGQLVLFIYFMPGKSN